MRRTWLAAATVLAAALVAGTALTAAVSLSGGFERAAGRADLADVTVRFDEEERADVDERVGALPNVAHRAYRTEITRVPMSAGDGSSRRGSVHVVDRGRRGYEIVAGRDLGAGRSEAVLEAGVAREWRVRVGDDLVLAHGPPRTVVGISRSPDNVAYPLARAPRAYVAAESIPPRVRPLLGTNVALLWLRDPDRQGVTLTQARAVAFGLEDLRFVTRAGVQVLIGQAAGIVIALLVAFSAVALATVGVMLGASARSEVARRLPSLGVERAVGFSGGRIAARQARRAALVAAPAAAAGLVAGALAVRGPSERLLDALNQVGPGGALAWWLAGAWLAIVALVALCSAGPAWRATRAPVAALLRGGELASGGGASRRRRAPAGGFGALGARLATARRVRWATTVAVLAAASATLVLLLGLASLLSGLRDDPGTVGKRYTLTARLDATAVADVRALDGVRDAAPRWAVDASAAYALGQPLRVVALPRRAAGLERPPLAAGRRRSAIDEAEVGAGLADALGLRPGSTLAVALPTGAEARFTVSGVVRSLENEGRAAYVDSEALEDSQALGAPVVAVALEPGADRAAVARGLAALGARPSEAAAATTRDEGFLGVLATVLRVVAFTVGLVCLTVLAQALALTARERRSTIALLRTTGAGRAVLGWVLAGACAVVLVPAAIAGVALEWLVLGPAVSRMAAGYAGLSLAPRPGHVALVAGGLAALAAVAVASVAWRLVREPVVAGLREEA